MLKTQRENNFNIKSLIAPVVITVMAALSGALAAGALGTAFALYGAVIGGVIGCALSAIIEDLPKEISTAIGMIIGAVYGIIYAKDKETNEIDNDDYLKGVKCAGKSVLKHLDDAIGCGKIDLNACKELLKGSDEIFLCIGDGVENPSELV